MADPLTIGLMVGGTILQAVGQRNAGIAAKQEADAQAQFQENVADSQSKQLKQKAGQERAVAQQRAIAKRKESTLAQSRATAVAAASGGGAFDPTVVGILGDLEAEGDYNVLAALYEGDTVAQDLEYDADLKVMSAGYSGELLRTAGKNEKKAGQLAAFSTILSGAGSAAGSKAGQSLATKYGGGRETWANGDSFKSTKYG